MFYGNNNGKKSKTIELSMAADIFLNALTELKDLKEDSKILFDELEISYGDGAFKKFPSMKDWLIDAETKLAIKNVDEGWSELVGENFEVLVKSLLTVDYNHIVGRKRR